MIKKKCIRKEKKIKPKKIIERKKNPIFNLKKGEKQEQTF